MKLYAAMTSTVAAMLILGGALTAVPALAQYDEYGPPPPYTTWQPSWDQYQYDRHHVILGRVTDFHPYRLTIMRRNGNVQTIDLKHGTEIYPTGATPAPGERAAIVGYYSNGTFIANRVILRM
ncbi:MAG: hypothetical protein JO146_07105 [Candidatus Eremiobacteraeota bacterium]|nr:hypothetical protein [Candidatus Eremiobacteraeota bacterium]